MLFQLFFIFAAISASFDKTELQNLQEEFLQAGGCDCRLDDYDCLNYIASLVGWPGDCLNCNYPSQEQHIAFCNPEYESDVSALQPLVSMRPKSTGYNVATGESIFSNEAELGVKKAPRVGVEPAEITRFFNEQMNHSQEEGQLQIILPEEGPTKRSAEEHHHGEGAHHTSGHGDGESESGDVASHVLVLALVLLAIMGMVIYSRLFGIAFVYAIIWAAVKLGLQEPDQMPGKTASDEETPEISATVSEEDMIEIVL